MRAELQAVVLAGVLACLVNSPAHAAGGQVSVVELVSSINPGSTDFILRSIEAAERDGDAALILKLDTPGGLVSSTREIVKGIMNARIPVIVYVAPDGAHAGSAGVFITLSGHVAAMSPGTNIGAAHPVGIGGKDVEKEGKDLAKKVENDTVAFMESIVEKRGRNKDWAVKAVKESVSITASAALDAGVIDVVATSIEDLLKKVDGREVTVGDSKVTLKTAGAAIKSRDMTLRQKITNTFSDPNIAYILFMIGVLGILMELYHPGVIFPGVAGGICLILAFISFQVLPINYGGLLLILLGVALLAAELYVTSYGVLGIGGVVAILIGSLLLVDRLDPAFWFDKDYGISVWTIVPTLLVIVGFFLFLAFVVVKAMRRRSITGKEGLVGAAAEVTTAIGRQGGKVFVHGEYWFAEAEADIPAGSKVKVLEVNGMVVKVEKEG
jgi:membrane-bound serine protease (ClpP class)